MNEEIWQQVLDGEKGKNKELEEDGLEMEDDMFTEDEDEEEEWEEEDEDGETRREWVSDEEDESGDEVSDLEDLEFAEVR